MRSNKSPATGVVWLTLVAAIVIGGVQYALTSDGSGSDAEASDSGGAGQGGDPLGGMGGPEGLDGLEDLEDLEVPGGGEDGGGTTVPDIGPSPSAPAHDATYEAFMAISPGSCLRNYYGGETWLEERPETADCDSAGALYDVLEVRTDTICPITESETYWSYTDPNTGDVATLCVRRRYAEQQCFPGEMDGDTVLARMDTAWPCDTDQVPVEYNQILRITGYYQAQEEYPPGFCSQDAYDQTMYYTWEVYDRQAVICATIVG
ncbi:hypothetical protein [Streptomyces sp. 7-21]|jgi:hypothetical protein|uniref:LppU/SCO3897 family protein n=1 Tax=Streptomyces sp. 7-21 TaxID=2802283 RepID=UPI00191E9738|nr:hypothetical protein [Streptomyces sp. 7-21]MBL1065481.1 hypothetical protein [Streptomyces sp. 7-21]